MECVVKWTVKSGLSSSFVSPSSFSAWRCSYPPKQPLILVWPHPYHLCHIPYKCNASYGHGRCASAVSATSADYDVDPGMPRNDWILLLRRSRRHRRESWHATGGTTIKKSAISPLPISVFVSLGSGHRRSESIKQYTVNIVSWVYLCCFTFCVCS